MDQPTTPAPRCEAHDGTHPVYQGECYAFGMAVPRQRFRYHFGKCEQCGINLDFRRDTVRGSVETLVAGTDDRHYHAPDHTGRKLDAVADGLEALQATLGAMLAERRAARGGAQSAEAQPSARNGEGVPLGGVPTLT